MAELTNHGSATVGAIGELMEGVMVLVRDGTPYWGIANKSKTYWAEITPEFYTILAADNVEVTNGRHFEAGAYSEAVYS